MRSSSRAARFAAALAENRRVHDRVTLEDRYGLPPSLRHHDVLRHARADLVACKGSAEVVRRKARREAGVRERLFPCFAELLDLLAVVQDARGPWSAKTPKG